jgi:hypothetical protein
MLFDVAGFPDAQRMSDVITQVTLSPLAGTYVKAELFDPWFVPFTTHW